jgi:predicted nucleic acid-binding protein
LGSLDIPAASRVYVDTSVIIYSIEKFPCYFSLLEPMWLDFERGKLEILSSELTLLETLVAPIRAGDALLIEAYEQLLLATRMQLIPISRSILREAANLRAATGLKTPDAIHAATAVASSCTLLVSNDGDFRKLPALPVVILDDVLAS